MINQIGFEIEVLAEVAVDAEIPVPGGCNSGSCSSCSNDAAVDTISASPEV